MTTTRPAYRELLEVLRDGDVGISPGFNVYQLGYDIGANFWFEATRETVLRLIRRGWVEERVVDHIGSVPVRYYMISKSGLAKLRSLEK